MVFKETKNIKITDAKPRGKLSLLKLSRGAKEEDDSQLVNDPLDDDVYCLDIEGSSRRRPSDDQVWLKIKDKTGVTNSTSFQQLDENKRKEMFLELKDCGASLRQLERLTGIGKGVIHRLWRRWSSLQTVNRLFPSVPVDF